jgi:hypothetical protein
MFTDNSQTQRFERQVGEHIVYATYRIDGKTLYINYVEAPTVLRGSGEAGKLMEDIVAFAKEHDFKIFPICGYATSWLRRHPEHQDNIAS